VNDAEAQKAFTHFGGDHRRAVIGHQGTRKTPFEKGLNEAMNQHLGRLSQIPLQMTHEPRAVVDDAEQQRMHPLALCGQNLQRAVMEIEVPEPIHVLGLETAHFPALELLLRFLNTWAAFSSTLFSEAMTFHESTYARVGRHWAKGRVLFDKHCEIFVVQLIAPTGVLFVLSGQRLAQRLAQ